MPQSQGFCYSFGSWCASTRLKFPHSNVIQCSISILFLILAFTLPCTVFYRLMHCSVIQTGALYAFCLVIGASFCLRILFTFRSLSLGVTSMTSQIPGLILSHQGVCFLQDSRGMYVPYQASKKHSPVSCEISIQSLQWVLCQKYLCVWAASTDAFIWTLSALLEYS